jgi:hypothetical protein
MTFPEAVPLGGYASGGGGTLPILGGIEVEITGNADLVLTLNQADPLYIMVTSDGTSTGIRQVKVPLIAGKTWIVENTVSDGQAIEVVGYLVGGSGASSGQGVYILPGACAYCVTDGTSVFSPSQNAQYPVTVTYQPGSVASGTVFTSFPALIKYITAIVNVTGFMGNITIRFDGGFNNGECPLPACAFPGASISFVGVSTSPGVPQYVSIASGTTFPGINASGATEAYLSISNCAIVDEGTTAPLATVNGGGSILLITMTNGTTWTQGASTASGSGSFAATGGGGIGINGTNAIIQEGIPTHNTRAFVTLDTGAGSFSVHNFSSTVVGGYALQGGDAGVINVTMTNNSSLTTHADAAAFNLSSVSADSVIGASLVPQIGVDALIDLASLVGYNPSSGSNWETAFGTVPTNVGQALDLIAAKLA